MSHYFFILFFSEKSIFHIWKLNKSKKFISIVFRTDYSYPQNTVNLQDSVSMCFQIYSNVQISISTCFRFTVNLQNSFSTSFQIYSNVQILISTGFRFILICRFRFLQNLARQVKRGICILNIFIVLLCRQIMYSKHSRFNQKVDFIFYFVECQFYFMQNII